MVERGTQVRRAAAGAHMKPVDGEACFETGLSQAAHVAGFAGAFQAVSEHNLAQRRTSGPLFLDQDLHIGLGPVKLRFHGIAIDVEPARPKVARDGQEVMVG